MLLIVLWPLWAMGPPIATAAASTDQLTHLPLVYNLLTTVTSFPPASYAVLPVFSAPANPPAAQHPDLNLALRGYVASSGVLRLVDYEGAADPHAPRLQGLLNPPRIPDIEAVYRVHEWDWASNRLGEPIASPTVTLIDLAVTPGEGVYVPTSGYDIGSGHAVLVLYAAPDRVTLKYTREDNAVHGYALHLEQIRVHPALLDLYRAHDAQGRASLPALSARQLIGVAGGTRLGVAIRDNGAFMDPRSRKDWW